jgi:hypothetical protein
MSHSRRYIYLLLYDNLLPFTMFWYIYQNIKHATEAASYPCRRTRDL